MLSGEGLAHNYKEGGIKQMIKEKLIFVLVILFIAMGLCLPFWSEAQGVPPLTRTFSINNLGITMSYPDSWSVAPRRFINTYELINVPAAQQHALMATARVKIRVQTRTDHAEAVHELQEIAAEVNSPSTFLAIGGWPALQRRNMEPRQQPSQGPRFADEMVLRITTAVAAGNLLVRLDGSLPSDADEGLIAQVEAIGRSLVPATTGNPAQVEKEIEDLRNKGRSWLLTPSSETGISAISPALDTTLSVPSGGLPGFAQRLFTGGNGELEIAVSPNAQTIVIARQNNWKTSNDGGQTFPFSGNLNLGDGDPSLAFGQSGDFYLAGIRTNCKPADATGPFGYTCTGVFRSTDNGQTFGSLTNAVVCPNNDPNAPPNPNVPGFCFPDQEHIAADRINAAPGGDQVYSVWRNFDATDQDPAIVCSQDNGTTWTAPIDVDSGFIPRVGVGQDGFVYVVYRSGGNIRINKYSSCSNGLTVQPTFPKTIAAVNDVTCPVPGLDRCNDGNSLSSIMVAVDDTNPNHVYVAYAHETAAGNQNILAHDSLDGGVSWPAARVVTVNGGVPGVRFMPWVCTTGGEAFVTWYDRRAATPCLVPPCPGINNDLTDYFAGNARLDDLGNLIAGTEFKLTDSSDPQCAAGWPCAPRATGDSESCSVQPQLAGVCCGPPTPTNSCPGSNLRCDFSQLVASDIICPAGETCSTGGGCPKYGDYNGNACAAGRLFSAWASATPPSGIAASGGIDVFFSVKIVSAPQIQVPGSISFTDTCVGSISTAALNVCNTGKADLTVNSIASSDPQFEVAIPSSGYPVVISPDFCFPFQVSFKPTSTGPKTATLTINSSDPANPSVTVQATGNGVQPIATTSGALDFGQLCAGESKTLTVQLCDTGKCDLKVTGAALVGPNCADLTLISPSPSSIPLTISPDSCFGFVVKFTPSSLTPPDCSLVINTNDPVNPTIIFPVTATTGAPHIILDPTALSGLYAFPPTVVDANGTLGCFSDRILVIRNNGACPLNISGITATAPFQVSAPTEFPIILPSGEETLNVTVRFAPTTGGGSITAPDETTGTLTVTSNDPGGAATADLCGEAVVQSGVRVLVVDGTDTPIIGLDRLTLTSKGIHTPGPISIKLTDVSPTTATICNNTIQYHLDIENLPPTDTAEANPNSSYDIYAKEGNKQVRQSFTLGQCEFKEFILMLQ
jgi:hypothetical protein